MITAEQFYRDTLGKSYDMDGVPVTDPIQCADYFKVACMKVLGYHWPTGGDGYVDYYWYNRNKQHPECFNFVTDWRQFQNGDFVVWPHKSRNKNTPFQLSHIAMFWVKPDGRKYMVGQNQPAKRVTEKPEPDTVWAAALGALRFKNWEIDRMKLPYGKTEHTYNGCKITAVRAPKSKGYDMHLLTGLHSHELKNIIDFDADNLEILAGVNANYFRRDTGEHLGCEGDGTVLGYQQIVPSQHGWLAFFQRNGTTHCWDTTAYYYDQTQVDFVCTPYAVRLLHGETVFLRSTNCDDKDDTKNTQTAGLKFSNGDWAVAIFSDCCPRDVYAWAITLDGIQDVILMDSGGSTQMFECTSGVRKVVKSTGRKIANALVLARVIGDTAAEDSQAGIPTPTPETPAEQPEKTSEIEVLKAENETLKTRLNELLSAIESAEKALKTGREAVKKTEED